MKISIQTMISFFLMLLVYSCDQPNHSSQSSISILDFLPFLIILVIVVVLISLIKKSRSENDEPINSSLSNIKESLCNTNKVVKLNFNGGLIGFLIDNPHKALKKRILQENNNGWRVVQIIPDISGNLFVYLLRFVLLIITLFLYTQANGYFIIFEQNSAEILKSTTE